MSSASSPEVNKEGFNNNLTNNHIVNKMSAQESQNHFIKGLRHHQQLQSLSQTPTISLEKRFTELQTLLSMGPTLFDGKSINCELLFDVLIAVYYECQRLVATTRSKEQQKFCESIKPFLDRLKELQLKASDFETIKIIGRGAFGKVALVRGKDDGNVYAMKTLNKLEMLKRAETACYREERDVLLHGSEAWFTKLHYAFQDETNLYLIMDYYCGGDLLTLLSKYDENFPEDMSRFYTAQIVLALSYLHDMGYIHRDVKPDNILIDSHGHIRLADFGSCTKVSQIRSNGNCTIAVGTPDYISPEILKAMEGNRNSGLLYSFEVDWWSLGVVIFESLYGETPFYAESLIQTYSNIMDHKHCFKFPVNAQVTDEAKDLISNLICDQSYRFKRLEQFKAHSWFNGIEWDRLREMKPPYQPKVAGPEDTSNFDIDDSAPPTNNKFDNLIAPTTKDSLLNVHLPFVGFTCTFNASKSRSQSEQNGSKVTSPRSPKSNYAVCVVDASDSTNLSSKNIDTNAYAKLENELWVARHEWSELSVKLNELRKEKNSISSRLRGKEEELDQSLEKIAELRQQLRNSERIKRQQLEDMIVIQNELEKEKQLRQEMQIETKESEAKLAHLEKQLSSIENQEQTGGSNMSNGPSEKEKYYLAQIADLEQEVLRLKGELDERIASMVHQHHIEELEQQVLQLQQQQPHWERQISEIIDWVGNEKEARNYLQQMAATMTKELELLKHQHQLQQIQQQNANQRAIETSNSNNDTGHSSSVHAYVPKEPVNSNYTTWQERRSARVDKQELLQLQFELANEIEDKQRVQEELTKAQKEIALLNGDLAELRIEVAKLKNQQTNKRLSNDSSSMLFGSSVNSRRISAGKMMEEIEMQLGRIGMNSPIGGSDTSDIESEDVSPSSSADTRSRSKAGSIGPPMMLSQSSFQSKQQHSFIVRTFVAPLKCFHCTSLMIGLIRQGLICETCGFVSHIACASQGIQLCPCDDTSQRPQGIDPSRGIGTAYEGYVKIPKARGGVRKGWIRMFVVVCDFKLFLYDLYCSSDSNYPSGSHGSGSGSGGDGSQSGPTVTPPVSVNTVIDMRDERFCISGVQESDVIHANKKDIPCIFRITTSMVSNKVDQNFTQLMLTDKEIEKNRWIDALHELHRIIRRNKLCNRNPLKAHTVLNSYQISALRHHNDINSCCVIDETRLLIGCDDCLLCCDLDICTCRRLTNSKRIVQCHYSPNDQLVIVLAGKQKHIKLIPIRGLDNDGIEWIKIPETKGANLFAVANLPTTTYVCVAIKKTLLIYEITRKRVRYNLWKEIQLPLMIQTLSIVDNMVSIGTKSSFVVYQINNREQPPLYLVNQECQELSFLIQNPIDALLSRQINQDEWILVFAPYGVYVDSCGKRTRAIELQFPSQPNYVATLETEINNKNVQLLLAFASTHINVFDLETTEWIQTINLKATKPLQQHGKGYLLGLTNANDFPMLVQFVPTMNGSQWLLQSKGDDSKPFLVSGSTVAQRIIQTASGVTSDLPKKNSRLPISGPSDFSHISHLGPGEGPFSSKIIDLTSSNIASNQPKSMINRDSSGPSRRDSTSSSQSSVSPYKF
ncbi:serine/threonine-protein kinase Genghis Khan [Tetranychus urticae]|uniref:serine/threonine-protein kinase Genghis Khan n=1 Tax=Tetranychus urticae TaxID=32264 RepID=UPI00077BA942|nr:serine/threonine-protein kinase Genghis Khan [Tetranychus urticae]